MSNAWFKLNKQKLGWTPVSWQGWVLSIGFIGFTVYNFFRISALSYAVADTLMTFIPQTLLFTGLYSVLCYFKSDRSSGERMLQ